MKVLSLVLLVGVIVLSESVAIPAKEKFTCTEEGRFVDSSDCGSFFECISTGGRSLTLYKRSCHGKAFNPKILTCTDPAKVKGCKLRKGRHYAASTRFSRLCKSKTNEFACGDCATQVTCSDGIAYETQCESNLRCVEGLNGFSGGVCHLKYKSNCRCQEPNTYYQDPYFNGTFFLCREKDSVPMFYNCPTDMYFNITTKTCLSRDGTPACTKKGLFVYPNDCNRYYMCTYAVEGWVQSRLKCPSGLLFNEETEVCENPCEWAHKDFKCEEEGRFRNPKDCSQYFECILDLNGEFLKMMRACPPDHHWDDDRKGCVYHLQSVCKIQSEGPIKQCRKDYKQICEKQKFPQIEERPTNVSEVPTSGSSGQNSGTEATNVSTATSSGSTETLNGDTQVEVTTSKNENQSGSTSNNGTSNGSPANPDKGQLQQGNEIKDKDAQKETSSENPKVTDEQPSPVNGVSTVSTVQPHTEITDKTSEDHEKELASTESSNSSSKPTNETAIGSTENLFQGESTSKDSVVDEQSSKPQSSTTTTAQSIEIQTQPTSIAQSSEDADKQQTSPEVIADTTETSPEEQDNKPATESIPDHSPETDKTSIEVTTHLQTILTEDHSTTETNKIKENESNFEEHEASNTETPALTAGTEFQFSNVGVRPLPFSLSQKETQIPVAIETVTP